MCHRIAIDYSKNTYLGIHLDLERMYAVLLDAELKVTYTAVVHYDVDLPEFETETGVKATSSPDKFLISPVMYIKALDILLNCLQSVGGDLHSVVAIGSVAHHYGAVYWALSGFRTLCGLNPLYRLHEQFCQTSFTLPITFWINNLLQKQCTEMDISLEGTDFVRRITGSECHDRMTGPEIRKIYQDYPDEYENTVRISLIGSFLTSLLVGSIGSIDFSDGSSMNLLDIGKKDWSAKCLEACAPMLESRLMKPIASNRLQGHIAQYYVNRWNFRPDCMILTATDESASVLSTIKPNSADFILSLGISDKLFMSNSKRPSPPVGNIMCHPYAIDEYMTLFSFSNGYLVRQRICEEVADGKWKLFNQLLSATPMGNEENLAFHFDEMDYTVNVKGSFRWDRSVTEPTFETLTTTLDLPEPRFEARAVIEGQLIHYRAFAEMAGVQFKTGTKIIVTGDYSINDMMLQIVADIFNAAVHRQQGPHLCVLGAALRARYAFYKYREVNCNCNRCRMRRARQPQLSYAQFLETVPQNFELVAEPTPGSEAVYGPLIERFKRIFLILEKNSTRVKTAQVINFRCK